MHDRENILSNHALKQEFVSASLSMDSDYDAVTRNLLADVNGKFNFFYILFPFFVYISDWTESNKLALLQVH